MCLSVISLPSVPIFRDHALRTVAKFNRIRRHPVAERGKRADSLGGWRLVQQGGKCRRKVAEDRRKTRRLRDAALRPALHARQLERCRDTGQPREIIPREGLARCEDQREWEPVRWG